MIIVTGAAGLLGSALIDHLGAQGYEHFVGLRRADCDLLDTPRDIRRIRTRSPGSRLPRCGARLRHHGEHEAPGRLFLRKYDD
jgi:nucleoside-diphosphate-sugar epimerase